MSNHPTTLAHQANALVVANHHRERWTREELELVSAFTDDTPDAELAIVLGRSLYALWNIQTRLRHEGVEGVLMRDERPASLAPYGVCDAHFVALLPTGECPFEA